MKGKPPLNHFQVVFFTDFAAQLQQRLESLRSDAKTFSDRWVGLKMWECSVGSTVLMSQKSRGVSGVEWVRNYLSWSINWKWETTIIYRYVAEKMNLLSGGQWLSPDHPSDNTEDGPWKSSQVFNQHWTENELIPTKARGGSDSSLLVRTKTLDECIP